MRNFHIPMNLDFSRRKSCKGHNHNIYQKSPKFMVNVILCARPPNSMTSFTRKQYPNAVIGAIYPNAVIWLVWDTYPNAAIWLVRITYLNKVTYANKEFFFGKKNNKITQKHLAMRLLSTALNNNKNQHFYKNEKYQTCRLRTQQTLKGGSWNWYGDICFYVNYNLWLNIGVYPLFCEKMVDYEEERLYLIKIDPVQELPGNKKIKKKFSHIF